MSREVHSVEDAYRLLQELAAPERLLKHAKAVSEAAEQLRTALDRLRAAASNFALFIDSQEDFREEIAVQSRCFAFSADTFVTRISLQQTEGQAPPGRKVLATVALVDATLVLPKVYI